MVSEQRADHNIYARIALVRERISGNPLDSVTPVHRFFGGGGRIRIEIDARQLDFLASGSRPILDAPQHVAVTASYIDDVQRLSAMPGKVLFQPRESGSIGTGRDIRLLEVLQARSEFLITATLVH